MKYKLIASDFDGTIYTSDYKIAAGTADAIRDYKAAGGIMMISTGRLYKSIKQHFPALGIDSGLAIVEQGSNVVDIATDKVVLSYNIDSDLAVSCLKDIEKVDGYTGMIYYEGNCIAPERNRVIDFFESIIQVKINYVGMPISEYVEKNGICPTKVLGIAFPGKQGNWANVWEKMYEGKLTFSRSNGILVEVVNKASGKGNALKYVAEEVYGIKRDEVIAIGDADNDTTMIRYAGLGIAVGNAMDTLKAVADVIEDTNDNSGVAKIIRKYGLGEEL